MRKCLVTLLLLFSANALATDTFNDRTNILNIDAVILNGIQYNNVVVRLKDYDVLGVGSSAPVTVGNCPAKFSLAQYNAIAVGMTLNQVVEILGCNYDPGSTAAVGNFVKNSWLSTGPVLGLIGVYFDATNTIVTDLGGGLFKARVGF